MSEHHITIRSVQVWKGGFGAAMIDEDGNHRKVAEEMEFYKEKSLSFKCSCGRRFQKWGTATDHILEHA